jgi:hypothetical protein
MCSKDSGFGECPIDVAVAAVMAVHRAAELADTAPAIYA